MKKPIVEFVSYDGSYPTLCFGTLIVRINGQEVNLGNCLSSGGSCGFDEEYDEYVNYGAWLVDESSIPSEYLQYKQQIEDVVNQNVPYGCCGGCL